MISSLLVANRGEIARRVFRTCRDAGITAVAVFSDPDTDAPHVAEADLAVRLPGAAPALTYLNARVIVAAALAAGVDALHPGYGFLAEDPGFARQVLAAGLTWIGPPPDAMEAMALKINARKIASAAGVPVLPELDPATVTTFPVLVKASAGGGGRGMRAAAGPDELAAALQSAQREALAAFGDGTVFCEPLLTGARHVEIQVLADQAGTVWALTERDCSVQRRYQKVIEESPSPAVSPALRERLRAAAAALASAVGYQGAGTVEFLVTGDDFYFLEFNTRLQVEHPVTECVHGIDLVALQLDIAEGLALPASPPAASGHAIEARLYAEDPADGFRPSGGPLHAFAVPDSDAEFGPPPGRGAAGRPGAADLATVGQPPASQPAASQPAPPVQPAPPGQAGQPSPYLRLDSGVGPGSVVSAHYDAMLAKLISWAPGRAAAARRLAAGLAAARICGPATNRDLLISVLRDQAFLAGRADTSFLDDYDLASVAPSERASRLSALAAAVATAAANRQSALVAATIPGGWRNLVSQPQLTSFDSQRGRINVRYHWTRSGIAVAGLDVVAVDARPVDARPVDARPVDAGPAGAPDADREVTVTTFAPDQVTIEAGGVSYRFDVTRAGDLVWADSVLGSVRLRQVERLPAPVRTADAGSLLAPMPGSVVRVAAAVGDQLAAGQLVLVIEAMKMEHQIAAPADGVLTELRVGQGSQVNAGDLLAVVAAEPSTIAEEP